MVYRAVGNRCAVIIDSLKLPVTNDEALEILRKNGFVLVEVDMVALARQCIGKSKYRRSARPSEAPKVVDCSSFIKWLHGRRGIWLPRRSIQQRQLGKPVGLDELVAGDVVFISGRIDYYEDDPRDGVGHVGIATGERTVIHAANREVGVIETPLGKFVKETNFRGVRRYLPEDKEVLTFETPPEREVETSDDLKWIIFQSLPNTKQL